jgi:two-component system response regulator HydG
MGQGMHGLVSKLLRDARQSELPIIAVAAGSGQIAQYVHNAGADLLLALNAGLYRSLGHGSLASFLSYGNANEQTHDLLKQHILPNAGGLPVVAGVLASDPTIEIEAKVAELKQLGVQGITNWPTIGFMGGQIREALEAENLGLSAEIELLRVARQQGLATFAFVLSLEDLQRFAEIGVDAYIVNVGLTPQQHVLENRRDRIQDSIGHINRMISAIEHKSSRPLCLIYGGPFLDIEDFSTLFRNAAVDGIAGGSVFERIPVEAITSNFVRQCKSLRLSDAQTLAPGKREMVGRSPAFQELVRKIERLAPYDTNILIEGETGVGKELAANLIHELSSRSNQPLITLNCGAIPAGLLESELFGHERGSFTGADRRRIGKFELANRGTLLLDEIADLSPAAQVALLRVLQEREIVRVGADRPIPINVRVLAATNQPLKQLVAEGRFRSDLYYRLSTITLRIAPMRERIEDLPVLTSTFLKKTAAELGMPTLSITQSFEEAMASHSWPGNTRELRQVISRAAILEDGPILRGEYFYSDGDTCIATGGTALARRVTNEDVRQALEQAQGNKSKAAAYLKISRKTLYAKLKELS